MSFDSKHYDRKQTLEKNNDYNTERTKAMSIKSSDLNTQKMQLTPTTNLNQINPVNSKLTKDLNTIHRSSMPVNQKQHILPSNNTVASQKKKDTKVKELSPGDWFFDDRNEGF